MDWLMECVGDVILAVLGVVLTVVASRVGTVLGKFFREKLQDECVRSVASTCVRAVEQMYKENSGSEKLEHALILGEKLLSQKGIKITARELRVVLEAAVSEMKGAFERS